MAADGTLETDDFAEFVTVLGASLDEPGGIDDLARAMHLSRAQLGRVVLAASGETPARFTRRILLERAAVALLRSESTVMQVAVDAGYDSHEGFLRAFERAYGAAPSRWRVAPGPVALPSPNGVHFLPPSGLRIPGMERIGTMDVLIGMVEHHLWLTGELAHRAGRLPEAALDAPVPSTELVDDAPTIRSLLSRIVGQLQMWNDVMASRDYDWSLEQDEPVGSISARLDREGPVFLDEMRRVVAEGRLDDTFVFVEKDGPKLYTYGGLIAHVLTFGGHRRVQVLGALTSHGVTDLGFGDPREWIPEHAA
ncbi:helix-turn-helix domain-containing protein [Glaciibacter flavus]|uniref:Helix-turn-helix domain-containing protein n=1 Tax=Orlajensenia flava TaxID=2565934 RepID=A0A4S4FMF7_9MICO|nr:helix-turn-helix domain-containing protein [Glaciibacter flavus]THG31324.1 helix-turn-helix domain-containing protein [Glaciibacter flavus]